MKTTKTKHSPLKAQSVLPANTVSRAKRRRAKERAAAVLDDLEQINLHAAGIDVGSAENFVCVPARSVKQGQSAVRSFGVFSSQQDDLVEWLKECGVTSVAMDASPRRERGTGTAECFRLPSTAPAPPSLLPLRWSDIRP